MEDRLKPSPRLRNEDEVLTGVMEMMSGLMGRRIYAAAHMTVLFLFKIWSGVVGCIEVRV